MVVSGCRISLLPPLRSSVAFVDYVHEIWIELQDRFTQQNESKISELKKALSNLTQGDDAVSIYYGNLKTLWDELSIFDPMPSYNSGNLKTVSDRY